MSLTDALLLEPHQQPTEVWFAVRSDGVSGSGTEADPYNATPRQEPVVPISDLATPGNPREAVATAAGHGYLDGDVVTIAGVTGPGAAQFNGSFPIFGKTDDTFKYWMTAVPGGDPQGTGKTASRMVFPFDQLMQNVVPASAAVHLGPGVFQTRGWRYLVYGPPPVQNPNVGWEPQSGQKIIGSGIAVTTLKTVYAARTNFLHQAIGVWYGTALEGFEASDFTVDCNLPGQPLSPPIPDHPELGEFDRARVACGAICVRGNHIRLRRIRAIRFGTQTVVVSPADQGQECFVLYSAGGYSVGTTDPHDCVTEDCIVEQPSANNTRETTCIIMAAREVNSKMYYHRGCVIRGCLVDCEYQDRPVPIVQVTYAGTVATVTTRSPHGRVVNDWVRITGALVNGSLVNPFNGSFKITQLVSAYEFKYTMASTPSAQPSTDSDMWVGRFTSHLVAVSNLTRALTGTNEWTVTITTAAPHFRVPGDLVTVGGVYVGVYPNQTLSDKYNGSFIVEDDAAWNPTTLKYKITSTTDPGARYDETGFVGVYFQGLSAYGGTAAVVERNKVFNCRIGGPWTDFCSTKDLTVRQNYYRGVFTGPYHRMGATNLGLGVNYHSTIPPNDRIKRIGDGKTARFTTQYEHGFLVGQAVKISGATVGGGPIENPYNGYFAVDSIPRLDQFTYRMQDDPGSDADSTPVPRFEALWQTRSMTIENNIIELIASTAGFGNPIGVSLLKIGGDEDIGSQRLFLRVLIRNNLIRHVDGVVDTSGAPAGIVLHYAEEALIENNVIDLTNPKPIQEYRCDRVRYFNNRSPAGALIQGADVGQPGSPKRSELSTDVEDALLLAMF